MSLVSEHMNEAIKHLAPRSQEEQEKMLDEQIDEWFNNSNNVFFSFYEYLQSIRYRSSYNAIGVIGKLLKTIDKDSIKTAMKKIIKDW